MSYCTHAAWTLPTDSSNKLLSNLSAEITLCAMTGAKKRASTSNGPPIVQTSKFFHLPGELRNQIYSDIDLNCVSLKGNRILYAPPLSLVCRQIRKEYEEIYKDEAVSNATRLHIYSTNFVCQGPALQQLQGQMLRNSLREYRCIDHVFLTNMYDAYKYELRQFVSAGWFNLPNEGPKVDYEVFVDWDPKSFDVEHLKEAVRKLHWCHRDHKAWGQVKRAVEETMKRYEPKHPPNKKRKRRSAKGSGLQDDRSEPLQKRKR